METVRMITKMNVEERRVREWPKNKLLDAIWETLLNELWKIVSREDLGHVWLILNNRERDES